MRMWMVDPALMCDKHLLGEHVELHMFIGSMKKGIRMDGYIKNDLLELSSLESRHLHLVEEMGRRGFQHRSEIDSDDLATIKKAYSTLLSHQIDRKNSENELFRRCDRCENRRRSQR